LNAGHFTDAKICLKELPYQLRIPGVVLEQENSEWRLHSHFFTLPGGGSLMTPQKTPSSCTALTNS
jgi:hypothetical protein